MYELIILGGGPAGMTAAVYAARKRITTMLLSKDIGGQVVRTMGIENYMGYQFIEGAELMQKFEEHKGFSIGSDCRQVHQSSCLATFRFGHVQDKFKSVKNLSLT